MADTASILYDPDIPVYEQPEGVGYEPVALETQKSATDYIDPTTATVEGRIGSIIDGSSSSQLKKAVDADSRTTANKSGLLGTTMAGTIGMNSLIDKGVEITTPDAALYGDMAKAQQTTDSNALLANQSAALASKTSLDNAKISGALTTQETASTAEIQKLSDSAQMQRLQYDNDWQETVNLAQLDAADAQALVSTSTSLGTTLTGSIERILRDTNVENKEDAVNSLLTQYKSQMNTAAALVNIELSWD